MIGDTLRRIGWVRTFYRRCRSTIKLFLLRLPNVDRSSDVQWPRHIARDLRMGRCGFIGDSAWICPNVRMGAYVMLAPEVAILGGDHTVTAIGVPIIYSERPDVPPTEIGDDVWIGYRATIMAGVTIGSGAVIAAGAVVTKDVPENSVAAGIPATVRAKRFGGDDFQAHLKIIRSGQIAGAPPLSSSKKVKR